MVLPIFETNKKNQYTLFSIFIAESLLDLEFLMNCWSEKNLTSPMKENTICQINYYFLGVNSSVKNCPSKNQTQV